MAKRQELRRCALLVLQAITVGIACQALGLAAALSSPGSDAATVSVAAETSLLRVEPALDEGTFRLFGDGPLPYRQTLSIDPPRIVLDLPRVSDRTELDLLDLDSGPVTSIRVEPYRDGTERGTRVIFDLRGRYTSAVEVGDTSLNIRFENLAWEAPAGIAAATSAPPNAPEGHYVIGPEDLLEISVFELPELHSSVRVQGDGTISLPLIGVIDASGMTETGLGAKVKEALEARYIKNPQVSVFVKQHESRKVSIIGAIVKPGTYPILGERTLLQMISEAGGLTSEAGAELLIIRNGAAGRGERIRVDLHQLVVLGDPNVNLAVRPGDVINVLVDGLSFVYVDGAVKNAGRIEVKASRPISLLQAIAQAGGATDRANPRQVRIVRRAAGGEQELLVFDVKKIRKGKLNDVYLQDGDIVVVPEALF